MGMQVRGLRERVQCQKKREARDESGGTLLLKSLTLEEVQEKEPEKWL